jgi:hypothetical protein
VRKKKKESEKLWYVFIISGPVGNGREAIYEWT